MEVTKTTGVILDIIDDKIADICIVESKTTYVDNEIVSVRSGLPRVGTFDELNSLLNLSWAKEREQLIASIRPVITGGLTVTTSTGKTFDANDAARLNMLSAIQASLDSEIIETEWLMADNTVQLITLAELKEAQTLAIELVGGMKTGKSLPGVN